MKSGREAEECWRESRKMKILKVGGIREQKFENDSQPYI